MGEVGKGKNLYEYSIGPPFLLFPSSLSFLKYSALTWAVEDKLGGDVLQKLSDVMVG